MRTILGLIMGFLLLIMSVSAMAAPSYLGPSGLIFSPDDTVLGLRNINLFYHAVFQDIGFGSTQHYWGANMGLVRDIEAGFTGATNVGSDGTDLLFNAKWRIVPETTARPGVAVGVVDVADQIDGPAVYFAVGKDISTLAGLPIRLNAGLGSGVFRHGFIGANWIFSPKLQLMAEYVGTRLPTSSDTGGNIGLRYALTPGLRIDAGLLDFQNFSIGFSYSSPLGAIGR